MLSQAPCPCGPAPSSVATSELSGPIAQFKMTCKRHNCRQFLCEILLTCSPLLLACSKDSPTEPSATGQEEAAASRVASIQALSGEGQRALRGSPLREPIVVRVLDEEGKPVSGAGVAFRPGAGHGMAHPDSVISGTDGRAASVWFLGPDPGLQTLLVSAAGEVIEVGARALDLEAELDSLFAAPRGSEVAAIRSDWRARGLGADQVAVELEEEFSLAGSAAILRIVSHRVAGVNHIGAIIEPRGAARESLPLLVFAHGGDDGLALGSTMRILAMFLGELRDDFVYVLPSFRGEPLAYGDRTWASEGPASPWNYDVDDALSLVNVALETAPAAIRGRYGVIGVSRGAGVALLMGARDPRIQRIVAFFGPTDMLNSWARDIARVLVMGGTVHKPGVEYLRTTLIEPWWKGALSLAEIRLELIRRSPVYFAADLPPTQLHHGDADAVVSVSQARSLMRAMEALGRGPPDFEAFIYKGGTHDILSLAGAIPRAIVFFAALLRKGT